MSAKKGGGMGSNLLSTNDLLEQLHTPSMQYQTGSNNYSAAGISLSNSKQLDSN